METAVYCMAAPTPQAVPPPELHSEAYFLRAKPLLEINKLQA
jgi:hypothetical protein